MMSGNEEMISFKQFLKETEDDQEQEMKQSAPKSFMKKTTNLKPEDDEDDGKEVSGGTIGVSEGRTPIKKATLKAAYKAPTDGDPDDQPISGDQPIASNSLN